VAEEVNNRMASAVDDLRAKYAAGARVQETSVDGPTGAAYKEENAKNLAEKKSSKEKSTSATDKHNHIAADLDDLDDENDDEDAELRFIREKRLRQIKEQQKEKLENLGSLLSLSLYIYVCISSFLTLIDLSIV